MKQHLIELRAISEETKLRYVHEHISLLFLCADFYRSSAMAIQAQGTRMRRNSRK